MGKSYKENPYKKWGRDNGKNSHYNKSGKSHKHQNSHGEPEPKPKDYSTSDDYESN